jgi:glycosyltransferase involved in cell wall biosynthesis
MPAPQRDAGSNAIFSHIRSLQRLGFEVMLVAADMSAPPDAAAFDTLGIGWCGAPWLASVEEVLRREADGFDVVYLHRVSMALRYTALMRHFMPRARLIYSVADLHFLRLARQAAAEERHELLAASRQIQAAEVTAARSADVVITHSSHEATVLSTLLPNANIQTVPWSIPQRPTSTAFAERRGVAFIGNYTHPPNLDAALWLVEEIMPLVLQLDPAIECVLVGSAMPDLLRRPRPGIVALGHVDDLAEVFGRVRLTVAPLVYGAGVKGKVLESFAACVPCVCTPVASEGLDLPKFLQILIGREAEELAQIIHRLHSDESLNSECGHVGRRFIAAQWSDDKLDARMRYVLGLPAATLALSDDEIEMKLCGLPFLPPL